MERPSPSKIDDRLTVCTVSFHNARHLALNWDLTRALNRDAERIQWVIAENTPDGGRDRLDRSDSRFRVIPGAPPNSKASYHHTEALHKTLEHVETRFLLVLDPDFYVIRPNWWDDVIDHMSARGLAIFGAPWHPRYTDKFRYFPTVHCTFFDLAKLRLQDLDFRPWPGKSSSGRAMRGEESSRIDTLRGLISLRHRRRESVDSGTRMYLRYASDPAVKSECLVPVYRLPQELPNGVPLSLRSRVIEWFLPDELCYLPKRRGYFCSRGLREHGVGASMPTHWEEFMWRQEPFGFHVRRNNDKVMRNEELEITAIDELLGDIVGRERAHQFPSRPRDLRSN